MQSRSSQLVYDYKIERRFYSFNFNNVRACLKIKLEKFVWRLFYKIIL